MTANVVVQVQLSRTMVSAAEPRTEGKSVLNRGRFFCATNRVHNVNFRDVCLCKVRTYEVLEALVSSSRVCRAASKSSRACS